MKKVVLFILSGFIVFFFACGPSANEKRVKNYQDSLARVDSIKKHMPRVESWDIFKLGLQNEAGLINKYGNKRIRITNLVVDNVMNDYLTMQCLAYSPKDSMLSNTSMKGNKVKKVTEWLDFVKDVPCKYNPDISYYFELQFSLPLDTAIVKQRIIKEEPFMRKSYYSTILTVEGDSIGFSNSTFYLRNCVIAEDTAK